MIHSIIYHLISTGCYYRTVSDYFIKSHNEYRSWHSLNTEKRILLTQNVINIDKKKTQNSIRQVLTGKKNSLITLTKGDSC